MTVTYDHIKSGSRGKVHYLHTCLMARVVVVVMMMRFELPVGWLHLPFNGKGFDDSLEASEESVKAEIESVIAHLVCIVSSNIPHDADSL